MYKIIAAGVATACVLVAVPFGAAIAETAQTAAPNATPPAGQSTTQTTGQAGFPLSGTYMQNVPCKGDGKDPPALKVTLSAKEIVSNIGVCTILDSKSDGKSYAVHVECKFPAGPLVGDITFTPRPDKTIKFVDRDNTYNAILHPCPN